MRVAVEGQVDRVKQISYYNGLELTDLFYINILRISIHIRGEIYYAIISQANIVPGCYTGPPGRPEAVLGLQRFSGTARQLWGPRCPGEASGHLVEQSIIVSR